MTYKSCQTCVHSWGYKHVDWRTSTDEDDLQDIDCTLNPTWVPVRSDHFCSQYFSTYEIPASTNKFSTRRQVEWRESEKQKQRAIKAEKQLKELRRQLREQKGSRNG